MLSFGSRRPSTSLTAHETQSTLFYQRGALWTIWRASNRNDTLSKGYRCNHFCVSFKTIMWLLKKRFCDPPKNHSSVCVIKAHQHCNTSEREEAFLLSQFWFSFDMHTWSFAFFAFPLFFLPSLHRNTCRGLSDRLFAPRLWFWLFSRSWWKPEGSTILTRRQKTSSASERAIFWRSVCVDQIVFQRGFKMFYSPCMTPCSFTFSAQILSPQDEWYKAEMNGHEGFVPQNYIDMQAPRWETELLYLISDAI